MIGEYCSIVMLNTLREEAKMGKPCLLSKDAKDPNDIRYKGNCKIDGMLI